ncbi:MAG: hxlB [Clostridiales bacterium]|jgi:6-phospho-3-hexuloisomerase|nr:hxlB [Clostridiales bacterium]
MDILNNILEEITDVIHKVKQEELDQFISCMNKDKKIFVDGEGRSGLMAKGFAMRLMHLGYTVYVVGETITPAVSQNDIFIVVSGSGESDNAVTDTKKALAKGCQVLAVTSKNDSTIAKMANKVLLVPGTIKSETGAARGSIQLLSSLFDQSLHITLDAVCLMLSNRDKLSNEEATQAHW